MRNACVYLHRGKNDLNVKCFQAMARYPPPPPVSPTNQRSGTSSSSFSSNSSSTVRLKKFLTMSEHTGFQGWATIIINFNLLENESLKEFIFRFEFHKKKYQTNLNCTGIKNKTEQKPFLRLELFLY